jgi:hypothetical protein
MFIACIRAQLFDEGHNVVSMILPEGVKRLTREQMLRMTDEPEERTTEGVRRAASLTKVKDVEYEEEYDSDKFNEIPLMAQTVESTTAAAANKSNFTKIREFSIDMWNGSPGLKHWGYDESNHTRYGSPHHRTSLK